MVQMPLWFFGTFCYYLWHPVPALLIRDCPRNSLLYTRHVFLLQLEAGQASMKTCRTKLKRMHHFPCHSGLSRLGLSYLAVALLFVLSGCGGCGHTSSDSTGGTGTTPSPFAATQYAYQRQILSADTPDAVEAVKFDTSGSLFLLGLTHVQKFKSDGTPVKFSGNPITGGSLLGVAPGGSFYVGNDVSPTDQIEAFNSDGSRRLTFGTYGSGDGQMRTPLDIAVDSKGNVYVTDYFNNRIDKFNPDGAFLAKFGSTDGGVMFGPVGGSGNGQLSHPTGIAIDSHDRLYVTDTGNSRVEVFQSDGTYLSQFGSVGNGNGQFGAGIHSGVTDLPGGPGGIGLDGAGNAYVIDMINRRVEKFQSDGTYLAQFSANGGGPSSSVAQGVAVDSSGNVYLALANRVDVYKPVQ